MENKSSSLHLSGLNGIRAIASLAVVVSHTNMFLTEFNLKGNLFGSRGYSMAEYGVTMFFVLSGFLITYLLQIESEKQDIDIRKFYIRRILRIWPLYYLYLTLAIIAIFIVGDYIGFNNILCYVFFAANIPIILGHQLPPLYIAHLWSIGVEEQFYLFWPWIIKKVKTKIVPLILVLIIIQNIIRVYLCYRYPHSVLKNFSTTNRFDNMMIGGLGAFLFKRQNNLFLKLVDNKITQTLAFLILGIAILNKFHINYVVDNFSIALVALIIIVGQVNKTNRIINLDNSVLDFLGKISFGIYVYHPLLTLFLTRIFKYIPIYGLPRYILVFASVITLTIVVSYLSFTYFERFFIKLKHKFEVVKSTASKNLNEAK